MALNKTAKNPRRKLVIYEDKKTGAITLRPCSWNNGKYKLQHRSRGLVFEKFSAFNAELGRQVKNYLFLCD